MKTLEEVMQKANKWFLEAYNGDPSKEWLRDYYQLCVLKGEYENAYNIVRELESHAEPITASEMDLITQKDLS